jgi:hypothetical protein
MGAHPFSAVQQEQRPTRMHPPGKLHIASPVPPEEVEARLAEGWTRA